MNQWINRLRGQFKASFLYKTIDSMTLFQMFVLIVIVAKIVRWTVMYGNQVVCGVGHFWINDLKAGRVSFQLFSAEEGSSAAGGNAAYLFHLIDFFHLQTYEAWEIYTSILSNAIVLVFMLKLKRKIRIYQWVIVAATIAVLNIFSFCLAKDPIQMLYFMAIALILLTDWGYVQKSLAIYGCLYISMVTFRTYYALILVFIMAAQVVLEGLKRLEGGLSRFLLFVGCMTLFGGIFLAIVYNVLPENYQDIYAARVLTRSIETANSGMKNWIDTESVFTFTLNWIVVVLRLWFPLELMPMGPKYWVYVVYQLMMTLLMFRTLAHLRENKQSVNLALCVYLGFSLGSGLFEPDYGSWIRHEAVCFAVIFIMGDLVGLPADHKNHRRITVS